MIGVILTISLISLTTSLLHSEYFAALAKFIYDKGDLWKKMEDSKLKYVEQFDKFEPKIGQYLNNQYCHLNSLNYAKKHKQKQIALCYYSHSYYGTHVHFVNFSNGTYYDNTMGYLTPQYDYRLIRLIEEEDFDRLDDILQDEKEILFSKVPFFVRLIIKLL